ncbi:MAG TPA: SDR family oxidoreductase [Acidimicrobiales bacterium]|nr:SDR family oxidoreductase [Acidimicrobiales bacterium]
MSAPLAGRVALVGGGSKGVGFASASALAAAGCDIALWSHDAGRLRDAAGVLGAIAPVRVATVAHDASDPECARAVAASVREQLGDPDILVMNGGGPPVSDPTETSPDVWRSSFQSVMLTQVELATAFLPVMRARRWGRIVALLSTGVRQPIPDLPYSNSCRAALAAWLKSCAPAVAGHGVTVNGVLTGRIDTERARDLDDARSRRSGVDVATVRAGREREVPAGRYGRPEELASLVLYLCSESAAYLTGAMVPVDGGLVAAL